VYVRLVTQPFPTLGIKQPTTAPWRSTMRSSSIRKLTAPA